MSEIAATKNDIREWFINGVNQGAKYMVIVCDKMDFGDYPDTPYYAPDKQSAHELIHKFESHKGNVYKIMEVYDLTIDMDSQLAEERAWNIGD